MAIFSSSDDMPNWTVWRQDDAGNRFKVKSGLTEEAARALVSELESRGHKQCYWASVGECEVAL